MGPGRLRPELGMELHREVPGMLRELRDLDESAVRRPAGNPKAALGQCPLVQAVELIAVAMTLVDRRRAVDAVRQGSRRQLAGVGAEAHGAAELVDPE